MENQELELMTGKLFWAVLPTVAAVYVGIQVLGWVVRRFAGVRAWNACDQALFDAAMAEVDAVMQRPNQ